MTQSMTKNMTNRDTIRSEKEKKDKTRETDARFDKSSGWSPGFVSVGEFAL